MGNIENDVHTLFQNRQYMLLYENYSAVINEMLQIKTAADFEDFIQDDDFSDEDVFWLYYSAVQGESLLIGAYEGDVSEKVSTFLAERLPDALFAKIQDDIQLLYVDIDDYFDGESGYEDKLEKQIRICNQHLGTAAYTLKLHFDDTYCTGVYFLSVKKDQTA